MRSAPPTSPSSIPPLGAGAKLAGVFVIGVACLVMAGWSFDVTVLKSVLPGLVAMNPMTAVAFIIAGAGLAAFPHDASGRGWARACGLLSGGIGAIVFCRYLFGWDLALDRLLFTSSLGENVMAPSTSVVFMLNGAGLFLLGAGTREAAAPAQTMALLNTLVSLLALVGYAYGTEKLYRVSGFIGMAVHTAACFLALALGMLCARSDRGLMARFSSRGPGGTLLRRLLLPVIAFPLALGALILAGHRADWVDAPFSIAAVAMAIIVFILAMLGRSARLLDAKDAERTRAEEELRRAHEGLEMAVEARTGELRQVVEALRDGVNILGTAAERILESTSQLAVTAAQGATSVAETTSIVEEVRRAAQAATDHSLRVAESARNAADISRAGKDSAQSAAAGIQLIEHEMQSIAESMTRLSERGSAIGDIIAAVEEISEESSLLAVNAAIQAAAAGEHGRGFAVVADEVKYLAGQSREATAKVRTILREIQQATATAVLTTEQASRAVHTGARASDRAGDSIATLAEHIDGAAQIAAQIAESSQQQLIGMDQAALAMEQIREATAQSAEETRQLEDSARNVNALGQRLKELATRHKPLEAR